MRKALVIGIDYYKSIPGLTGAVNDAHSVKAMLDRHADGSVNFGVRLIVSLRKVRPPLELADLQRISEFFPSAGFQYQLDPSYEPERSGTTFQLYCRRSVLPQSPACRGLRREYQNGRKSQTMLQ